MVSAGVPDSTTTLPPGVLLVCQWVSRCHRAVREPHRRHLNVHSEVDPIHQDLHMTLWLHIAAHDAEYEHGLLSRVTMAGMMVWKGRL